MYINNEYSIIMNAFTVQAFERFSYNLKCMWNKRLLTELDFQKHPICKIQPQ